MNQITAQDFSTDELIAALKERGLVVLTNEVEREIESSVWSRCESITESVFVRLAGAIERRRSDASTESFYLSVGCSTGAMIARDAVRRRGAAE